MVGPSRPWKFSRGWFISSSHAAILISFEVRVLRVQGRNMKEKGNSGLGKKIWKVFKLKNKNNGLGWKGGGGERTFVVLLHKTTIKHIILVSVQPAFLLKAASSLGLGTMLASSLQLHPANAAGLLRFQVSFKRSRLKGFQPIQILKNQSASFQRWEKQEMTGSSSSSNTEKKT